MRIFENGLCSKCKMFLIVNRDVSTLSENLPFNQVINKEADHSLTSSNIKTPQQTFPEMTQNGKCSKTRVFTLGILT